MQNVKLLPWFVDDQLPRHEDYKHTLNVTNSEELRREIVLHNKNNFGVRMYLGGYELGEIRIADDGDFFFGMTDKLGNGIFATMDGILGLPYASHQISAEKLDEVLENGCYINDFIYMVFDDSDLDGVITTDSRVSAALIQEGYMSVLALKDAVHEDFKHLHTDTSVLLTKYSLLDWSRPDSVESLWTLPADKENRLWFVNADVEQSVDFGSALEITSVQDLLKVVNNVEEPHNSADVRMYLGRHEIGGILNFPSKSSFSFECSEVWWRENIGAKVEELFGTWFDIPYEKMEEFLGRELTIEEFVEAALTERFGAVVTDDTELIWKLLHEGYRTLCTLDGILHTEVKNDEELRRFYGKDRRVILVKYGMEEIFYSDEECEDEDDEEFEGDSGAESENDSAEEQEAASANECVVDSSEES